MTAAFLDVLPLKYHLTVNENRNDVNRTWLPRIKVFGLIPPSPDVCIRNKKRPVLVNNFILRCYKNMQLNDNSTAY